MIATERSDGGRTVQNQTVINLGCVRAHLLSNCDRLTSPCVVGGWLRVHTLMSTQHTCTTRAVLYCSSQCGGMV